jgi:hypothetical protein
VRRCNGSGAGVSGGGGGNFLAGPGQEKEGEESSGRPFGGRCGAGAGRGVEQSRVEGWEQRGRWCSRDKI